MRPLEHLEDRLVCDDQRPSRRVENRLRGERIAMHHRRRRCRFPAVKTPTKPTHVIGICGGAVAGSEAAKLFAERGALAIVFEQNARPYGKIEDGLPRWHVKLREKEYARIDDNLDNDGVLFVPLTRLGKDIAFSDLTDDMGLSAVILATGAWRDRPLPIEGIDRFVGCGLIYQNPLVYWFNHYPDPGFAGPHLEIPDGAVVVGGGLASIDVVKLLNIEVFRRALLERGIEVDAVAMEHAGIAETLDAHGLSAEELGVEGCTLYYRRRMRDMPLASVKNPTPAQLEKLEATRTRIMEKVMRKFLVRVEECCVPIAPIEEDGRLAGLVFRRTEVEDGRLREVDGSVFEARAPLVVSSIGSLPQLVEGVPTDGDLYPFDSEERGVLLGVDGVFGLGNVLTGKGNIRDSRINASVVAERVIENLIGVPDTPESLDDMSDALHEEFRARAQPVVDRILQSDKLLPEKIERILERVRVRWDEVGYAGEYRSWIEKQ
jgi:NADPH-dependent glutamate synthase beta subunit-like oxidoreductase